MSYSIVESAVNPPTQTTATAFFSATNDRTFAIRISVTANGATIIPSTLINVGGFLDGNAAATGLFPGNTYAFVMTIRRNSNNEQLGTRTVNISTLSAPPPAPPSWSSNFPSGQVGSGYSGSATATFPTGGTWGFNCSKHSWTKPELQRNYRVYFIWNPKLRRNLQLQR